LFITLTFLRLMPKLGTTKFIDILELIEVVK